MARRTPWLWAAKQAPAARNLHIRRKGAYGQASSGSDRSTRYGKIFPSDDYQVLAAMCVLRRRCADQRQRGGGLGPRRPLRGPLWDWIFVRFVGWPQRP